MDKVIVKFIRSWRGYSAGEVAGFDEDQAGVLIEGEVAKLFKPAIGAGKAPATAKPGGAKTSTKTAAAKTSTKAVADVLVQDSGQAGDDQAADDQAAVDADAEGEGDGEGEGTAGSADGLDEPKP